MRRARERKWRSHSRRSTGTAPASGFTRVPFASASPGAEQPLLASELLGYALGRLMSEVLLGRAGEAALDRYESLRRPAAQEVLALAGRLTEAATLRRTWQRVVRNFALSSLAAMPWFRRRLALNLSGIARRSALPAD